MARILGWALAGALLTAGATSPVTAVDLPADTFAWPASGYVENGDVAWHLSVEHLRAVDISLTSKDTVTAAAPGEVIWAGAAPGTGSCTVNGKKIRYQQGSGLGNYVVVRHASGPTTYYTQYAHFASVSVRAGDQVSPDSPNLGVPGSTGCSTGTHLHLEIGTTTGTDATGTPKISGERLWAAGDSWPSDGTIKRRQAYYVRVDRGQVVPGTYPGLGGTPVPLTIMHDSGPAGFWSYATSVTCPAAPTGATGITIAGFGAGGGGQATGNFYGNWPPTGMRDGQAIVPTTVSAPLGAFTASIKCLAHFATGDPQVLATYTFTQTVTEPGRALVLSPAQPKAGDQLTLSPGPGCQAYGSGGTVQLSVSTGGQLYAYATVDFNAAGQWAPTDLTVPVGPGQVIVNARCTYDDHSAFDYQVAIFG